MDTLDKIFIQRKFLEHIKFSVYVNTYMHVKFLNLISED